MLERDPPVPAHAELQQAADDILDRITAPEAADLVAGLASQTNDLARKLGLSAMLVRRLPGDWNAARTRPRVVNLIAQELKDPATRLQGITLAAATRDGRYRTTLEKMAQETSAPIEARVAAIEAVGSFDITPNRVPEQLIAAVRGKASSDPVAEAAVRAMAGQSGARGRLTDLVTARDYPLGLRREALHAIAQLRDGGSHIIELARAGRLPDDLKTEATTALYASPDRRVREAAAKVLPLPKIAGGHTLPSMGELMRGDGDAGRGREVFFRAGANSCGGCHRVQGRGQWVGPDLSTIGVKYGRDELIHSVLNPSAAIGYNFRSVVAATADGRVITGLLVEETADRLVLKTATGERITLPTGSIEDRRTSDVSLMPEGLAQSLTERELVNLLVYLTTLKQPVSIVGQYHVVGPFARNGNAPGSTRRRRSTSTRRSTTEEAASSPGAGSRRMPRVGWILPPWRLPMRSLG